MPSLPRHHHPPRAETLVTVNDPAVTRHYHPKSTLHLAFALGGVHFMGFDKWVMTCLHHYRITQSIFTAPNTLPGCTCSSHPPPQPLATTDLTAFVELPFPECPIVWQNPTVCSLLRSISFT